jgi:hypothetical protein
MDRRIVARWQDWSGKGVEHSVVRCAQASNSADGVVISTTDGQHFAVRYQIRCDGSWTLEHACIEIVGEQRKVELMSDGRGKWTGASGIPPLALGVFSVNGTEPAPGTYDTPRVSRFAMGIRRSASSRDIEKASGRGFNHYKMLSRLIFE